MKQPTLNDFELTDELIEYNKRQHEECQKRLANIVENRKLTIKMLFIISLVATFIAFIILACTGFEKNATGYSMGICVFLDVIFGLIWFQTQDDTIWNISLEKRVEIEKEIVDQKIEKNIEAYKKAISDYNHYLEQNDKNYWINMSGLQFEREIATLFRTKGYDATVTSATGDGGVDIVLRKNNERIAVQCKHHSKPVGPNDVRALQGVVAAQNFSKGIFVSLNGYTATVHQEIDNGNVKIDLLELADILQMAKGQANDNPKDNHNSSNNKEKIVHLGDLVTHKTYGEGIIIEFKDNYFSVDFASTVKKFVFPNAFSDGYLSLKDLDERVFGEYSFRHYWIHAKNEYKKTLLVFPDDDESYLHLINGLKEVMKIEGFDFKALVLNFEKICPEYYHGGKRFEISEQKGLIGAIVTFESYLTSIREKRLSVDGFREFLIKESSDNEIYLSNRPDDGESIISALINKKKPIKQLIPEQIDIYVKRLQHILSKENIDICLLARYSASADRSKFIEKYPNYDDPTTDMILEWFTRYYKKTITTI